MKKEVEKKAAINQNLETEQLYVQTRQLVLKAQSLKYNKLQLIEELSNIWNEISQTKIETENLSEDVQKFTSKLTKFLEYYQKDILFTNTEYWKDNFQAYNTSESFNNRLTSKIAMRRVIEESSNILLSMFILFTKKQAINLKNINYIARHTLKYKHEIMNLSINPLYTFFFSKLYFQSKIDLPTFSKSDHIVCIGTSIMNQSGFKEFEKSNSSYFRKTKSREVAIAAIWFINTYF